ncbi:MAG: DUF433 domain-containing protein [Anaerolineae bacterium]|nr:DUF433 domain-containing protein [Anaerolineae bacterium]
MNESATIIGFPSETTLIENTRQYFDFVNENVIQIKGHRLGIEHVLAFYHEGYTPDQIAQEFPGLSLEVIYATITFYLANQSEMDAYLQRRQAIYEQAYQQWKRNPTPLIERLRAIREEQLETV